MSDHASKPIDIEKLKVSLSKFLKPKLSNKNPETPQNKTYTIESEPLSHLTGLDVEEGLSRALGKEALFVYLLDSLSQSCSDYVVELESLLQQVAHDAIKKLAHAMKGAAGNASAKDLFEHCKKI